MTAPTRPATSGGLRPIIAMTTYTLRTSLPAKRRLGLLIPCVAAVLFGLLVRGFDGEPDTEFAYVAALALFGLVLPVTSLVVGDAVLGAEIRRGAFTFTWMSPVPTWQIVLARWIGGSIVTAGCSAVAFALAALAAGASSSAGAAALSAAFGAVAYVAVFMAIGCVAQRAAVWSLAYVFLVERLLGAALSGIAQLSPSWEARAAFIELTDGPSDLIRDGIPQGSGAIVRLILITIVALVIASVRLPHLKGGASSD